jgi:YegS/Rv2252/BmrU family lipid kinase
MQRKKVLFIVNPISGTIQKKGVIQAIENKVDKNQFEAFIRKTEYAGHATEIAQEAVIQGFDVVVAVGGDGTVNEVAKSLIHSKTALYIIPTGSGNGLARHLGIPLDTTKALEYLHQANTDVIDVCQLNEKAFFCTSGVGFDATVAHQFSLQKQRGFLTYIKTCIQCFRNFKLQEYEIQVDNEQTIKTKAFIVALANAGQYGNNAYIAPKADIADGLIDICIVKALSFWACIIFVWRLFTKTLHKSKLITFMKAKKVRILRSHSDMTHIDGEPVEMPERLDYSIDSKALNVIH